MRIVWKLFVIQVHNTYVLFVFCVQRVWSDKVHLYWGVVIRHRRSFYKYVVVCHLATDIVACAFLGQSIQLSIWAYHDKLSEVCSSARVACIFQLQHPHYDRIKLAPGFVNGIGD